VSANWRLLRPSQSAANKSEDDAKKKQRNPRAILGIVRLLTLVIQNPDSDFLDDTAVRADAACPKEFP
jgi:hypothetical protein